MHDPINSSSRFPLCVPDEMLFLLDQATQQRAEAPPSLERLAEIIRRRGGYLEGEGRAEDATLVEGENPFRILPARQLNASRPQEAFELFQEVNREMEEQEVGAIWQPNWLTGAAQGQPGGSGGTGAGPGARPMPWDAQASYTLPFRRSLLTGLRQRARGEVPIRLIFLDTWNSDREETCRLNKFPLFRLLNDYAEGEPFRLRDYEASRDPDPFPMPDHGLFAAYLAGQVIGTHRLQLHESILGRLHERDRLFLEGNHRRKTRSCVTIEAVRVLDEHGVGDSLRLVQALMRIAATIRPGERVILNMSLFVNIPMDSPVKLLLFKDRWPGHSTSRARLDRALYEAIQALHRKGVLLVASAGNNSWGEESRLPSRFPAAYDEVLDVTASRADGMGEAWYANRASHTGVAVFAGDTSEDGKLDLRYPIVGPFTDARIPLLGPHNDIDNHSGQVAWAGTSFAAPLVSGLAALLWCANPTQSASEVRDSLRRLAQGRALNGTGTPYIDLFEWKNGHA